MIDIAAIRAHPGVVEFAVELFDPSLDPDTISFDLTGRPMVGDKVVGKILAYTTQQYVGEDPI